VLAKPKTLRGEIVDCRSRQSLSFVLHNKNTAGTKDSCLAREVMASDLMDSHMNLLSAAHTLAILLATYEAWKTFDVSDRLGCREPRGG
jgi:hypothetical protein